MITRNCLIVPFGALVVTFSSEIALAVENADVGSSISMWPIIVAIVVLVVLRKQLIAEATPHKQEHDKHEEPKKETKKEAPESAVSKEKSKTETETKPKAKPMAKAANINLKDDSGQCQASTSKGTRCKRKSNLEDTSVTIDGTTYDLTVCSQHNKDVIKPFSELIK